MAINKQFKRLSSRLPLQSKRTVVGVGVVAVAGAVALVVALAAGAFMAVEPENGTLANGATQVSDPSASEGKAVQFAAASPSPTPGGNACYLPGAGSCGPYSYPQITNSNGYNTYVGNQESFCGAPGSCGPETLTAYSPGNWSVTSTQAAGNTGVLTYPDIQQLTNNWGNGGFSGGSDMPISGLSVLSSTYAETMNENSGTYAEAAYDIWTSSGEVMIWVDTTDNRGSGGAAKLGTGTIGGIPMTYYNYQGGLPIIKLNTNQRSGTINIMDGLHFFQQVGAVASNASISQLNFGWEICSTGGVPETFQVTNYSLTMTPK